MSASIATLTFSDTRTDADDEGGARLGRLLKDAGFSIVEHRIVREDIDTIRAAVRDLAARADVDAIVTTGGTGIGPRDVTIPALEPLFERSMVGFGEEFRRASWGQIGPRAILSNASAGVVNQKIVMALPGSPKALDLAVSWLVAPVLEHAIKVARGGGHGPSTKGA